MVFRERWKHLRCSLRMPNIWNFIKLRLFSNPIYHRWQIVLAELPEAIIEEITFSYFRSVTSAVNIASVIADPDIIPSVHQLKSQWFGSTANKAFWAGEYSMLQQNRLFRMRAFFANLSYSEHFKNIAIFCCNRIAFSFIFGIILYQLSKTFIFIQKHLTFSV